MIQTVGIKFEAQGLATVTAQMKTLGKSINALVTGIKKLETLDSTAAINNLNRLAIGMGNAASKLSLAANEINAAVTAFTGASAVMGRGRPVTTTSSGSSKTSEKLPWYSTGAIMATTGNLAKYTAAFGLLFGAKEFATDTLLGESRRNLIDSQLNLHAIGYKTKADKRGVEYAAGDFVKDARGNIKREEFMKAVAEMGSALPHDDPRSPAMNKQTHADLAKIAVAFGKLSQMSPDAAAQHLESLVSAVYNMGKPDVKWRMRNEPGYMADYAGTMAGQAYKAIDIFKMRGQDQAEFMKYMTPTMLEKGWDFPTMMALAGLSTTVGFKASSTGRGSKTLLDAHPDKMGEMLLAGSEDRAMAVRYKAMKAAQRKVEGLKEFRKYEGEFRDDLVGWLTKRLGPAAARAQARGFNMADFSGTDFLPLARMLTNMEALKELAKYIDVMKTESPMGKDALVNEYLGALDQEKAGTRIDNLVASWTRLTQAIADSNNPLVVFTGSVIDLASSLINWSSKIQEKLNTQKEFSYGVTGLLGETPYVLKSLNAREKQESGAQLRNAEALSTWGMPLVEKKEKLIGSLYNASMDAYYPMSREMASGSGMSLFQPPNIAPSWQQQTQQVKVSGEATVTVYITDQGFFERVNKAVMRLMEKGVVSSAGEAISNIANSTGRTLGSFDNVQPDFQGGQ